MPYILTSGATGRENMRAELEYWRDRLIFKYGERAGQRLYDSTQHMKFSPRCFELARLWRESGECTGEVK